MHQKDAVHHRVGNSSATLKGQRFSCQIFIKSKEVDNSTEIIEIDSDIATLKKYRKTVNADNVFHKWFFIGDSIITVFEIPKDSIKYEYAIDLE